MRIDRLAGLLLVAGSFACSSDQPDAGTAAAAEKGAGMREATAGGRPTPSITLAASDVATVTVGSIEEGMPIAGDLRPIETVNVRARIEGDVLSVLVREGERVSAGQLLARFDAGDEESAHESAIADRAAAQTDLATAEWNLEQSNELLRAGAISQQDQRVAQQAVASSRARLAAANARLRSAGTTMRDTRVLAPTTGVIDKREVEGGEHVTRGATLFTLVRNDELELAAALPARQAGSVRPGQPVHFVADGRAFEGIVARVSPTIDPTSRSVTVYVRVSNRNGFLRGGTFATGRVVARTVTNALIVPAPAIHQSADRGAPFVYRILGKTIEVAPITLGIVDERTATAEVLSGLAGGDRVIVGQVGSLGRGMQVQIVGEDQPTRPGAPRGGPPAASPPAGGR